MSNRIRNVSPDNNLPMTSENSTTSLNFSKFSTGKNGSHNLLPTLRKSVNLPNLKDNLAIQSKNGFYT